MPRKILFIMCDQLRYDYLGCTGHPSIRTPHIDALAARGVLFQNNYVQSPICGPSRASTYTGRYTRSHGALWNNYPVPIGERGLGDHLRPLGVRTALCGKSHWSADTAGMARLGVDPASAEGRRIAEGGFELWDRLDGVVPDNAKKQPSHYIDYLRAKGYEARNPWHDWANSAQDAQGNLRSGWLLENATAPARVAEQDSETPYTTTRAIEFMEQARDDSWCLHLSYIKPHWPYIVPAPYNDMYSAADVIPVRRHAREKENAHPLVQAYHAHRYGQSFSREEVRQSALRGYMGLITQIDDQIGRVMRYLDDSGQAEEVMVVFTSDHGDYMGDHWLGEKELFHQQSVRVPLIIMDPSAAADATRGTKSDALTEAIDLLPSFIDFFGGAVPGHILEGHSLMPLLHGGAAPAREVVISEYFYGARPHASHLAPQVSDCNMVMAFDGRWKLVTVQGHRPILFDLETDPDEFDDLGADPSYAAQIARLQGHIHAWALGQHARVTMPDSAILSKRYDEARDGILLGFWDEQELAEWRAAQPD